MNEKEKRERFYKVATNRTNKILDMLRLLGNCANSSNYSYDDEDVRKIFSAIESSVKEQKIRFVKRHKKNFEL